MMYSVQTPFGWYVVIDLREEGNPTFSIARNGFSASISADSVSNGENVGALYEFAESALREGENWLLVFRDEETSGEHRPVDIESRFLHDLRIALEASQPRRNSLPRLIFQIGALEGRFASTPERISNTLELVTELSPANEEVSLAEEKRVTRVATEADGQLKRGSSVRVALRLAAWLEQRGAVGAIRKMYKPLPALLRYDAFRAFTITGFLVAGATTIGPGPVVALAGATAWIWLAAIIALAAWTLLPTAVAPHGGPMSQALRPV